MEEREFSVGDYHVSYRTGFVIEEPLATLPGYFEPWNILSKSISTLYKERRVRDEVHKIPLLDHTKLEGYRQRRLAHLQLSFITAGYMWQEGDTGVAKVLPKSIAVPFYSISKTLGVLPVLSHMDLVLANYTLTDSAGDYDNVYNIDCNYFLPGEEGGKWFATVTMLVELEFAGSLRSLEKVVNLVKAGSADKEELWQYYNMEDIVVHLNHVEECINRMKKAFSFMHEKLSTKCFFNTIRPFLGGWGGEGNALPEGVIFEGISDQPIQLSGGSAAQSTSFQALDAFLGVQHSDERKAFLLKMRQSMPPDHVRFIEDLEAKSQLLPYVEEMAVPKLTVAYNKCINALSDFRSYHLAVVIKYIVSPAKQENEDNFKSLDEKGTSGTDLMPFLKGVLHNTKIKILPTPSDTTDSRGQKQERKAGGNLQRNISLAIGFAAVGLVVLSWYKKGLK